MTLSDGTDIVMWVILAAALVGMGADFLINHTNLFGTPTSNNTDSESEEATSQEVTSENTNDSES